MVKNEIQNILINHDGLNFKLLNPDCNKKTLLSKTLADRGVKNVDEYESPHAGVSFDPSNPFSHPLGMYLGKWFARKFNTGQTCSDKPNYVYILVDNDADGFTSAAYLYKYLLKAYGVKSKFIFTPGKNHGIKTYSVKNKIGILKNISLLIIPDASLSLKDIQFLKHWHIPYLIIDHHDINNEKYDRKHRLHLFNNQWHDTKINKEFTGVGMVRQFCMLLDNLSDKHYSDDFMYLLSIGQVGDVSDVADPEVRSLVLEGFRQMIKSKICKLTVDTKHLSAHELSFSIIPKINAVCRTGSLDDKRDLLNALVDNEPDDLVKISFRRKSKIDHKFHKHYKNVDHYYLEAKQLNRIKSRQKRAVKRSLRSLKNVYETKSFIIALDKTGQFQQEEAGLIATQLSNQYQKPTLVFRTCYRDGYYKGSARGNTKVMKDFRRFCNQTHKFVYAEGHPNAFGAMISDTKLDDLLKEYKNVDLNDNDIVYNVDQVYIDNVPNHQEIIEFDNNRSLFGGHVKEPQLGFIGLHVKPSNIKFFGSVFTMNVHGLKFIMFNSSDQFQTELFNHNGDIYLDLVGSPDIKRFMKYHYPQIIINNIKLTHSVSRNNHEENKDVNNFYF